MAGGSNSAVLLAVIGNGILTLIKFIAFIFSMSPAMMSEAVHSFADTLNQFLLWVGIRKSERPADSRYQYGYGGERYLYALLSAVGIFVLGCGVTIYHGIHSMIHPPTFTFTWWIPVVLVLALFIDGFVLSAAVKEVNAKRGDTPLLKYITTSTDPTLAAVLLEDLVATLGVLIAAAGIFLGWYFDEPRIDAASSILIGLMLGGIAVFLGIRNRSLILGPSIPPDVEEGIREFLLKQESIDSVRKVRTRVVGSDHFAFAAEIDYDGRYLGKKHATWLAGQKEADPEETAGEFGFRLLDTLSHEIDRIEAELRKKYPRLQHLDLESDDNPAVPD